MPIVPELRKRKFRAALALKGLTAAEFAAMNGFTAQHLSYVLSGKRTSAPVLELVDRFIGAVKHSGQSAAA